MFSSSSLSDRSYSKRFLKSAIGSASLLSIVFERSFIYCLWLRKWSYWQNGFCLIACTNVKTKVLWITYLSLKTDIKHVIFSNYISFFCLFCWIIWNIGISILIWMWWQSNSYWKNTIRHSEKMEMLQTWNVHFILHFIIPGNVFEWMPFFYNDVRLRCEESESECPHFFLDSNLDVNPDILLNKCQSIIINNHKAQTHPEPS